MTDHLRPAGDHEIVEYIDELIAEEHRILGRPEKSDQDMKRLTELRVERDRLWDLKRQRQARRDGGQDPELASERTPDIVERYLQ